MKKLARKIIMIAVVILFTTSTIMNAHAYVLQEKRLNGGVGNYYNGTYRYYWYNTNDPQKNNILASIYKWNHTGSILVTKINFSSTTYKPSSVADFYHTNEPNVGANGYTLYYVGNSTNPINIGSSNWDWARIYINDPYYNQLATNELKQGVICHEFGHVMGLDENNSDPNTIMCQAGSGRVATSPQLDDLRGINAMY